jgi:hypothetical protein
VSITSFLVTVPFSLTIYTIYRMFALEPTNGEVHQLGSMDQYAEGYYFASPIEFKADAVDRW